MKKRILITGLSGFLGSNLASALKDKYDCYGTIHHTSFHESTIHTCLAALEDLPRLEHVFDKARPEIVIHTAAISNVQSCKANQLLAYQINVEASLAIAKWCHQHHVRLIFTSTDLVFDGQKGNYIETDSPSPGSYYGETKWEAEKAIISVLSQATILRLALLYGFSKTAHQCFFQKMIENAKNNKSVKLYTNQYRSPLFVNEAALVIENIIEHDDITGLFHLGGVERMSRYDMGIKAAHYFHIDQAMLHPITMQRTHTSDCSISSKRLEKALNIPKRMSYDTSLAQLSQHTQHA